MPSVNWTIFEQLPGSTEYNFEMLCRSLIRRHYGKYGNLVARAAQPGVEFHLKLHSNCSLGDSTRWYGWQCRWYDLPSGRALGSVRRKKIEEAIRKTEKELPNLTDWILWTRRPLTAGDQNWFYKIKTHMKLALWTSIDVEEHLSGDGLIFRNTYFGELILTSEVLTDLHNRAVAPIRRRWQPEVHQAIAAEREIRRIVGEMNSWSELQELANQIKVDIEVLNRDIDKMIGPLKDSILEMVSHSMSAIGALTECHDAIVNGDIDLLRQLLSNLPTLSSSEFSSLPRKLRAVRERAGLTSMNMLTDTRHAYSALHSLNKCLDTKLVAVVADAGCGKTQFAAQFSSATDERPAGILLHGRDLQAGHSLSDLAHRVMIQGNPCPSIEALVAAVDATGQRARRRIPIVIDGLNEAEDPRDWKNELAILAALLEKYSYVLLICTLRPAFADEALPLNIQKLEIPSFGHDTIDAIRQYFAFYRINAADAELPIKLLSHPLTLRLFCEVTNPNREKIVGIEAMPRSLTALFDRYLGQVVERIAELAPRNRRYYEQDIRTALGEIGISLWEQNVRGLDIISIRAQLGDTERPWNESIIYALEQDGVILRSPGNTPNAPRVSVVYDALAGHLIADAILARNGYSGLVDWIKSESILVKLAGKVPDQHTFADDVLRALVGLIPRRLHGQQLWTIVSEPLRTPALQRAAELEGTYIDAATVNELAKLILIKPTIGSRDLFHQLWQTRGATSHPLNAEFLDAVLRPLTVANRDLRWTEWIRFNKDEILSDLKRWKKRWQDHHERSSADELRARWIMWTLTSTVREVRDQATLTLYWFGRGDANVLFNLTLESLSINDLYVPERLLSVSYGVVMAHQLYNPKFATLLSRFLGELCAMLVGDDATLPTNHWLARLYVQGMVIFSNSYYPNAVPAKSFAKGKVLFASAPVAKPISKQDPRASEVNETLQMDFENYTLGQLFDDRPNYDMKHIGHQAAVAHILGTVLDLGWRPDTLGEIDKDVIRYSRGDRASIERYGKKYGWIGFYTYAGILMDAGKLPQGERLAAVQIDPSFPKASPVAPIKMPLWVRPTPKDDKTWFSQESVSIPDELLYSSTFDTFIGPWIAVYGHLSTQGEKTSRRVFCFLTAMLVNRTDVKQLLNILRSENPHNLRLPEAPSDYYTFAGEIPWSAEFARADQGSDAGQLYRSQLQLDHGSRVDLEILASRYAWEGYHTVVNQAGGALVPSRSFSAAFDLRGYPQSFNQYQPNGSLAALSFKAPTGFDGELLYLREDLVYKYAAGRQLIWHIQGEKQIYPYPRPTPDWLIQAQRNGQGTWHYLREDNELSRIFAESALRRTIRGSKK